MISFIAEEQLKLYKTYKTEYIPEEKFPKYNLKTYIEKFPNPSNSFQYLSKVVDYAMYVTHLLETYLFINEQNEIYEEIEKKEADLFSISKDFTARMFNDDLYGKLNYKEKMAINIINLGKKVYKQAETFLELNVSDKKLKELVEHIRIERKNLPEKSIMETEYYKKVLPEEEDIYHYLTTDLLKLIESIFPKYFLADRYYTNSGSAIFVLSAEDYLFLVGNERGKIKEFPKFYYYKTYSDTEKIRIIIKDLSELSNEIKTFLLSNKCFSNNDIQINQKSDFEIIKNSINAFSEFCEFIPETEEYFRILFNKKYIQYIDNKFVYHKPCTQKVMAALLKDRCFKFAEQLPKVPKEVFISLFGKTQNQMEQREENTYESEDYQIVKQFLLENNVPMNT